MTPGLAAASSGSQSDICMRNVQTAQFHASREEREYADYAEGSGGRAHGRRPGLTAADRRATAKVTALAYALSGGTPKLPVKKMGR